MSWKTKFIDSTGFMASTVSNHVDNLTEEIHIIKCRDCGCFIQYENVKGNLIIINVYQ